MNRFSHDFATQGLPDKLFAFNRQTFGKSVQTESGVQVSVENANKWSQAAINSKLRVMGDFDIDVEYADLLVDAICRRMESRQSLPTTRCRSTKSTSSVPLDGNSSCICGILPPRKNEASGGKMQLIQRSARTTSNIRRSFLLSWWASYSNVFDFAPFGFSDDATYLFAGRVVVFRWRRSR